MPKKARYIAEFGDFQTPEALALEVVKLLKRICVQARTIVEPSCGQGAFLVAASRVFPEAKLWGLDINEAYLQAAREKLEAHPNVTLKHGSFFSEDWVQLIGSLEEPILILGNPPWVTNAELGSLGSANLPKKTNFQGLRGFDALTGKSNFDISEWMLLQNLAWLQVRHGAMAVLCKTAVARKVARYAWKHGIPMSDARIYPIDAGQHFGAAVDACLFYLAYDGTTSAHECGIYDSFESERPKQTLGYCDGSLVSDVASYERLSFLRAKAGPTWRSGVKHDCSKVMELERRGDTWVNGLGEVADIESTFVFPLCKSSDVATEGRPLDRKSVIVTQRKVGEDTSGIGSAAPKTWAYLEAHADALAQRGSIIYRGKPRFSIFGIGDYAYAPWKIAISGMYKRLAFRLVGPVNGKPMMFDDTVYFLPFASRERAETVLALLMSPDAQSFLGSMVFWDDKRPITSDLLRRLDLNALATHLGHKEPVMPEDTSMPLFAAA